MADEATSWIVSIRGDVGNILGPLTLSAATAMAKVLVGGGGDLIVSILTVMKGEVEFRQAKGGQVRGTLTDESVAKKLKKV